MFSAKQRLLLIACCLAICPLNQLLASSAEQTTLKKLQEKYAQAKSFSADFRQIVSNKRFGSKESSGQVTLQKPGMMYWQYDKPQKKKIIADGKSLWIFDQQTNQVLINPRFKASQLPLSISFLWGEGQLTELFQTEKDQNKGLLKIVLKEKNKQGLQRVELLVDKKKLTIIKTTVKDLQGNTNTLHFSNTSFGKAKKKDRFTFKIPKNATVVRLDQINFRF